MRLAEAVDRYLHALDVTRDASSKTWRSDFKRLHSAEAQLRDVLADWKSRGDEVMSACGCGGRHLVTVDGVDLCGRCASRLLREVKAAS